MRMSSLYSMKALTIYLTSFCSTGGVYMLLRGRVAVYIRLGVMRLSRNICGEVERGVVRNSRGDLTLTQAGRIEGLNQAGRYCQL